MKRKSGRADRADIGPGRLPTHNCREVILLKVLNQGPVELRAPLGWIWV
jgi:hypothetical protein